MLTNEETKALVLNRIRRSRETWAETKGIIEGGYWYAAANRMYYACYYMVSIGLEQTIENVGFTVSTLQLIDEFVILVVIKNKQWKRLC